MNSQRHSKIEEMIRTTAGEYLAREANRDALITVTAVDLDERQGSARILISVLPTDREEAALQFVTRKTNDYRLFFMEKVRMNRSPRFTFAIDVGEKNRQKLDQISHGINHPPAA